MYSTLRLSSGSFSGSISVTVSVSIYLTLYLSLSLSLTLSLYLFLSLIYFYLYLYSSFSLSFCHLHVQSPFIHPLIYPLSGALAKQFRKDQQRICDHIQVHNYTVTVLFIVSTKQRIRNSCRVCIMTKISVFLIPTCPHFELTISPRMNAGSAQGRCACAPAAAAVGAGRHLPTRVLHRRGSAAGGWWWGQRQMGERQ
jgi:hypothetical protein